MCGLIFVPSLVARMDETAVQTVLQHRPGISVLTLPVGVWIYFEEYHD